MIPYKKKKELNKNIPCITCDGSQIDPENPDSKCPDCVDGKTTLITPIKSQ